MDFTIVICSGAWPLVQFFEPLIKAFKARGHIAICKVPPSYPAYNPSDPPKINPDTKYLRAHVLEPLLEEGKDIVIFMHSYGGAYGPGSLEGTSKKEREAKGLKGGVIAGIFNAAFVAPQGTTPLNAMGLDPENLPEWIDHDVSHYWVDLGKFSNIYSRSPQTLSHSKKSTQRRCFTTTCQMRKARDWQICFLSNPSLVSIHLPIGIHSTLPSFKGRLGISSQRQIELFP